MPEYLNWQQACKFLGCSKSHFYDLVNNGILPSIRYGKVKGTRVKKEDCERYQKEWLEREDRERAC